MEIANAVNHAETTPEAAQLQEASRRGSLDLQSPGSGAANGGAARLRQDKAITREFTDCIIPEKRELYGYAPVGSGIGVSAAPRIATRARI